MAKNLNNTLFIVQARLNSSRLPGKMLKSFAGTTLFDITLNKVKQSIVPNSSFYASVNEPELIKVANKYDVNVFKRSKQSIANDDEVALETKSLLEWRALPFDNFIIMNACNPLVTIETINQFVIKFLNAEKELLSVKEHKHWFYKKNGSFIQNNLGNEQARMTFNSKYAETLYSNGPLKGGKISDLFNNIYCWDQIALPNLFIYPDNEFTDIDYQYEFDVAEQLYILRNSYDRKATKV